MLLTRTIVDPSARDNFAVRLASRNGHLEVVKLLLTHPKVDPSADDNYAIRWASKNGYLEVVKLLLSLPSKQGVYPTVDISEAIRLSSQNGHSDVVKVLKEYPMNKKNESKVVKYNLKTIKNCKYITEDGDPHLVITFL